MFENPADFWAMVWLIPGSPLCQGALMAATTSSLRVLYDAKEKNRWRIMFEALLCSALSLCTSSVIEWMSWPPALYVAAGGAIGLVGVKVIRELIIRFLGRKLDAG